ncbi:MAG TPA: hypothetical protein GX729_03715 [Firmicutes bacterium]|nr:hypothetical protein [Bacillota bacterium]
MVSRVRAMAMLVALSLIVIISMVAVETRLIQNHFLNVAVEQVKASAEQVGGAVVELDVPPEDSDTCREVAFWIYYNTGMRVLITDSAGTVVVDSSTEGPLTGQMIESELLKATITTGETNSFDLPAAGQDQMAVSVPWQSDGGISGALMIVGPLKAFAKEAMDQLRPFILQSGLGAIPVALAGAFVLSPGLSKRPASQDEQDRATGDTAETGSTCTQTGDAAADVEESTEDTAPHQEVEQSGADELPDTQSR